MQVCAACAHVLKHTPIVPHSHVGRSISVVCPVQLVKILADKLFSRAQANAVSVSKLQRAKHMPVCFRQPVSHRALLFFNLCVIHFSRCVYRLDGSLWACCRCSLNCSLLIIHRPPMLFMLWEQRDDMFRLLPRTFFTSKMGWIHSLLLRRGK